MGNVVGGIVSGIGSAVGGIFGANASKSAANAQERAAYYSLQFQKDMFAKTQANMAPFIKAGGNAFNALAPLIGAAPGTNPLTAALTKPFAPTMEQLMATPGYQFTLDQGLKATQNSFAAQGLGSSGAAMKGAAGYASGLASTTYQQQFANYWSQNQNIYNMLSGLGTVGANAAAGQGSISQQVGANVGNAMQAGGAAQAAGIVGSSNALTGALGNWANMAGAGMFGSASSIGNQLSSWFGGGGGGGGYIDTGSFSAPVPAA